MILRTVPSLARALLVGAVALAGCDGAPDAPDGGSPPDGRVVAPPDAGMGRFDPFALLADPYLPARVLPGRMRLSSSRMPEAPEGVGNDDYGNYLRVDGEQHVLMEAGGPGVVTRIWFTGREPATQDYSVLDRTILHVEIDGAEVEWASGGSGISLGELTSGTLPGFPRPWAAGRDLASNGLVVAVPIPFAASIRMWIDEPPGIDTFVYYQIDWRELPAGLAVESFDATPSDARLAALEAATELWIARAPGAAETTVEERTIAPGEAAVLALDAPSTVRAIAVAAMSGELDALEGGLVVDGETVVEAPLVRWTFAAPPTEPSESALATVAPGAVALRYPFPVRSSAELTLHNGGTTPVTVRASFEHDPGDPDADLGALRISCGTPLTPSVGQNLPLVDLADRRGHYAGQFLIVRSGTSGFWSGMWVLEGDHEVVSDGEWLLGTGLEDYFGGAFYYLRGPFALPTSGASGRSGTGDPVAQVSQYRHHLLDTIPFERTFRFEYESFVADSELEHCLYWYEVY